ncbi:MAG: hypothetical protein J3R72DRAFT_441806 [Linnemannia gamsii]|nr:MAG: hypothetical protein J3R72DRAFT_441806 [Linnemannia gamsii]
MRVYTFFFFFFFFFMLSTTVDLSTTATSTTSTELQQYDTSRSGTPVFSFRSSLVMATTEQFYYKMQMQTRDANREIMPTRHFNIPSTKQSQHP